MQKQRTAHGEQSASRLKSADWLTVQALADLLHVRVGHLRALVARQAIPFGKIGRLVRFHWPTVERWVTTAACRPPKPTDGEVTPAGAGPLAGTIGDADGACCMRSAACATGREG